MPTDVRTKVGGVDYDNDDEYDNEHACHAIPISPSIGLLSMFAAESTAERLIENALRCASYDDDDYWPNVRQLKAMTTDSTYERLKALTTGSLPKERALAADVLAEFGIVERFRPEETKTILLNMLRRETDTSALQSICAAMSHTPVPEAALDLARLVDYPDAEVRHMVSLALAPIATGENAHALISLMKDEDENVRDWATFGLGQSDVDTPEVRAALRHAVNDDSKEVEFEALCGLAKRGDKSTIDRVIQELSGEHVEEWVLQVAEEAADPVLLPSLLQLKTKTSSSSSESFCGFLDYAIKRCTPAL